jgi:hypothetical protein
MERWTVLSGSLTPGLLLGNENFLTGDIAAIAATQRCSS